MGAVREESLRLARRIPGRTHTPASLDRSQGGSPGWVHKSKLHGVLHRVLENPVALDLALGNQEEPRLDRFDLHAQGFRRLLAFAYALRAMDTHLLFTTSRDTSLTLAVQEKHAGEHNASTIGCPRNSHGRMSASA